MLQNVLFNDKWLKEFSVIPLNFNTKEVQNFIKLAETIWVLPIIGNAFYEELLYQIKHNALTDENSTLLVEALYPYLGFAVTYEALPTLWLHTSEVSITKGKSDNSDPATLKDMTYYESFIRRQLEARKDYFIKWLDSHADSFPLYHPTNCGCDSCCGSKKGLNTPNPAWSLYSTRKRCTNLK